MSAFLKRWLITTLAVLVAAEVVPGIHFDSARGLIIATLLLGVLNAFVRPILVVLSLPLLMFSLGLFLLVINALLLWWVGHLKEFHVDSFWAAFWGSLLISIVSLVLNTLTKSGDSRAQFRRPPSSPPPPPPPPGQGPVIDV